MIPLSRIIHNTILSIGTVLVFSCTQITAQVSFQAPIPNPDGIEVDPDQFFYRPEFHDLGNDGDLDIFCTYFDNSIFAFNQIAYFKNKGDTLSSEYDSLNVMRDMQLPGEDFNQYCYGDIDNDGDLDVLLNFGFSDSSTINREFAFYENNSADTLDLDQLVFNPFGLEQYTSPYYISFSNLFDFDNDGDLDLMITEYSDDVPSKYFRMIYLQNIGTPEQAEFDSPIEVSIDSTYIGAFVIPSFGDLDGDGDADLLAINVLSDETGAYIYFENSTVADTPTFTNPITNPFNLDTISVNDIPTATLVDYDNDGDLDLFTTSTSELFGGSPMLPKTQLYLNQSVSKIHQATVEDMGLSFYPNPVEDVLHFHFLKPGEGHIILYDLQGKAVLHKRVRGQQTEQIDISQFAPGTYILYYENQTQKAGESIIVK